MTALAVAPAELDRARHERGLDGLIVRAWAELRAGRSVACPICRGEMEVEYGAQARPISGRCRDCGARLT